MLLKASLLKRATSTREEYKIQLGLEIKDNDNTMDVRDQIRALVANQNTNYFKVKNI